MSQSDYIKYKRISLEIHDSVSVESMPSVLNGGNYIQYKGFSVENTTPSIQNTQFKYIPDRYVNVFGIQKDMCNNECLFQNFMNCSKVVRPNTNMMPPYIITRNSAKPSSKLPMKLMHWQTPITKWTENNLFYPETTVVQKVNEGILNTPNCNCKNG